MRDYHFYIEQLSVGYDRHPLIRDIELGVDRGEILTLIGPNGAGKTTILKSIAKQLAPISGSIYIDRQPISSLKNRDFAKKVSVVLTRQPKTELMTCWDVVASGRYPFTGVLGILDETDKTAVQEALMLVGAWDMRDQDIQQLSDGQRQRIVLARAICQEPKILILDEPTSYLDLRYELELLETLRTLAKERNVTIIMSLHKLDLAQKISDHVLCVKGERIHAYGTPEEIFQRKKISEIFELDYGSYNTLFGSVELVKPEGKPELFVIAGNGSGIKEYRRLQKRRIPFITGILHKNDIDYQVAQDLAALTISTKSFEAISDDDYQEAVSALRSCRYILNCLQEYGTMNARNQALYEEAYAMNIQVIRSSCDM